MPLAESDAATAVRAAGPPGTGLLGVGGTEIAAAVAELARRLGQSAVEFAASGSAALETALEILGVGPGDEVVPDVGCRSVAASVVRRGVVPVFTGVGEALALGPGDIAAACGARPRAVVAVPQYGLPCDVAGIQAAVGPDVVVIEDVPRPGALR